ncbi:hypothetical protein Pst134EA_011918 [Puccinia striiformis f. sp. tritici]|uniref:hypothetical protein n=1 Tax=Puccinia striiformis f. sp. tritici TaxID=168172 RepID=UPI002008D2F7|nr:hypothetical protein Pst134EA_011918 [Puccinia striiformis f. sp. tritici]KAH9456670.1 hypothetical protein Pst134EB_012874 [Puccinia striiformis f. sp. tritici]KAH9468295.1 hypothetical protein Pst134EA_011918 [Puccinia striiformis f. sp. tritici]KAI9631171.1 hypothetical protein KEM48_013234 [Puccinia striiformis f. sp. tritici PST-130]
MAVLRSLVVALLSLIATHPHLTSSAHVAVDMNRRGLVMGPGPQVYAPYKKPAGVRNRHVTLSSGQQQHIVTGPGPQVYPPIKGKNPVKTRRARVTPGPAAKPERYGRPAQPKAIRCDGAWSRGITFRGTQSLCLGLQQPMAITISCSYEL